MDFFSSCVNVGKVFCNFLREADNICVCTANTMSLCGLRKLVVLACGLILLCDFQDFNIGHFTTSFGSLTLYTII